MDKEHARFILRSFRPDGADAADPDFATALQYALRDRELGEWFARERASDAGFSTALQSSRLPENLRNEIVDALAYQRGDLPHAESTDDAEWSNALATLTPPPGMRDTILAAMHACTVATHTPARIPAWRKFGIPIAAAAAVALAFTLPVTLWQSQGNAEAGTSGTTAPLAPLPIELVRAGFINTYQTPGFALESGRGHHRQIVRHLEERGLPCPSCIPPGLRHIEGLGCREIIIDGHRGALICYEREGHDTVHLIIFRVEEIQDPLPYRGDAAFAQHGEWAAATWRNNENAFVLLGHTDVGQIASLF